MRKLFNVCYVMGSTKIFLDASLLAKVRVKFDIEH